MLQYEKIMNQLIWEIKANKYPVGSRLPVERELALRFNTSQKTIHNAISRLENRGFIKSQHGSGNYVISNQPDKLADRIAIIMNCSPKKSSDDFLKTRTFMDMIGSINTYTRPRGVAIELMIYQENEPVTEKLPEIIKGSYFLNLFFTATDKLAKMLHSHGCILLSVITSFHEKRFKHEYPDMPYVLYDYRPALEKAFEFYKSCGIRNYAFFSQGAMGEKNYNIFAEIAEKYDFKLENFHFKLKTSAEAHIYSGARMNFFRDALHKLPDNTVIFSDGVWHISELIHSFNETETLPGNYTFCITGVKNTDEITINSWHIDCIPFFEEKIAIYAAQTLLECINGLNELPLCQKLEAEFLPDKRRNSQNTAGSNNNSQQKREN